MSRFLGIDYGDRRVGLALSDSLSIFASPLPYISNNDQTINEIINIISEKNITRCVIGNPLHLSGNESEKSIEVKQFAEKLQDNLDDSVTIIFWDERLSTSAVMRPLLEGNMRRKNRKEKIDSAAACFIFTRVSGFIIKKRIPISSCHNECIT